MMRMHTATSSRWTFCFLFALLSAPVAWAGENPSAPKGEALLFPAKEIAGPRGLGRGLRSAASAAPDGTQFRLKIILTEQADTAQLGRTLQALPASERRRTVVAGLNQFAGRRQAGLLRILRAFESEGRAKRIRPLWIANAIAADGTIEVAEALARRQEVARVEIDIRRNVLCDIAWGVSHIGADNVWSDLGFRGDGIVVAVIDTGTDYTHSDLQNRSWINPGEIPGNFIDDDGNGYVDDVHGYDFTNDDSDPMDDQGHGTHVAGTVAGDGSGGTETGVAPGAKVMIGKVLDALGSGFESDVWEGIQYAADNGAHVISMSLGWQHAWGPDRAMWRQTCENAIAAGVVMVIAGGNEQDDGTFVPPDEIRTPGDVPDVVTIAATDSSDVIAYFSSRGPVTWQNVPPYNDYPYPPGLIKPDVSAPGVGINSTIWGGGYSGNSWSGTSMATPHVSGLVALMLEASGGTLNPAVVKSILESTAIELGDPGKDNYYGSGRVDAIAAVQASAVQGLVLTAPNGGELYPIGANVPIAWLPAGPDWQPGDQVRLAYSADGGSLFTTIPGAEGLAYDAGSFNWDTTGLSEGYTYRILVEYLSNPAIYDQSIGDFALVNQLLQITSTSPLPGGVLYQPYSVTLQQQGGVPSYDWFIVGAGNYLESDPGYAWNGGGTPRGWNADDGSWSYTFPWPFPFYGTDYTSAYVCSNGFIDFAIPDVDYSNTSAELIQNVRIAPLWEDLWTIGPGEDIYITETSDFVVIRWVAETFLFGDPVEFELVLHRDGTIQFNYSLGLLGYAPTVGVSSGDGSRYTLSTWDGSSFIPGSVSTRFELLPELAPGLSLDPVTGQIAGTPTEPGTFNFTVGLRDSGAIQQSDSKAFELEVVEDPDARQLDVSSTPITGVTIAGSPPEAGGETDYSVSLHMSTSVTLTAPPSVPDDVVGHHFLRWVLDGLPQPDFLTDLPLSMADSHAAVAEYSGFAQRMELNGGWDLVSLAGVPVDPSRDAVFPPGVILAVWEYNNPGGYILPDEIKSNKGYWVLAEEDVILMIPLIPTAP